MKYTAQELRAEADKIDRSEYYADLYGNDERDRYVFALRLAADVLADETRPPDAFSPPVIGADGLEHPF